MKFISTLLLLVLPALSMATIEEVAVPRDLQIADWHVTITAVSGQSVQFHTGPGAGTNPNIKVHLTNICRLEGASRIDVGDFYPTSNVPGIDADGAGIINNPGADNSFDWKFVEGINANSNIYVDDGNGESATVNFCILIGLYDNDVLIDYAETKMTYNINLITQIPELTGYTVTQAEEFNDADDTDIAFDGTLLAYFCDPNTKQILTDDGSGTKTHQGSILNVCFQVDAGQFEVADIMEFTVKNALAAEPSQQIITNSDSASALYSTKQCVDGGDNAKNVCLVSFLLKADFYDFAALTLTGEGSVLLEFGTAGSRRRRRERRGLRIISHEDLEARQLQADPVEESFQVEPQAFEVEQLPGAAGSSATSAMTSLAAFGALAGAALAL